MSETLNAQLMVSTRVLVQLGSELVTDVEQAILEAVKNAYDADSPSCAIEIDTREVGVRREKGHASKLLPFIQPSDTVTVEIYDEKGQRCDAKPAPQPKSTAEVERRLSYLGRITITDTGEGLSLEQLRSSWLVISGSAKRAVPGQPKEKTRKGRTPLGDKGLGRLGTMKLGDILLVESAGRPDQNLASAQFRWKDCDSATTVDQVPVTLNVLPNTERFKGTRVSVLGLRDILEWRRKDRGIEIAKSMAKLISPFEARSTFRVTVKLDGVEQSLASVTSEMLSRAVAVFDFSWGPTPGADTSSFCLEAKARFRKQLFIGGKSGKSRGYSELISGEQAAKDFKSFLLKFPRLRGYTMQQDASSDSWFVTMSRRIAWPDMMNDNGSQIVNPGAFEGAFYYFNLDELEAPDEATVAGIGVDKALIKSVAGVSILRDGFRVRSQGDWLDIAAGMTSGSTYHMRVNNTVGYFALTGEKNFALTEKSDREGFVEDAAFRGFAEIARHCKMFANESLEGARRALDAYAKQHASKLDEDAPRTANESMAAVGERLTAATDAKTAAEQAVAELRASMKTMELEAATAGATQLPIAETIGRVQRAVSLLTNIQRKLETKPRAEAALGQIKFELASNKEQIAALFEGAAVGLSARGLAHELRTHLVEIRRQTAVLRTASKKGLTETAAMPSIRAIRGSCSSIASAAALIDPMLPRSRAVKETLSLYDFITEYVSNRKYSFENEAITVNIIAHTSDLTIRANRARLLQVIDNLVRNSIYWLRRGRLTGEVTRPKSISFVIDRGGFSVSDSGPGVARDYEESLFELFVSGRPDRGGGQGLGLFIISELLALDGCDIELTKDRNAAGRRFTFKVNLRPLVIQA